MSEIRDKINKLLAAKTIPDVDKQRVQKELDFCENNNLLEDIYILYQKVQNNYTVGDVNVLNCAILYYLGITSVKHDPAKDMQIQARRTYGRAGFPDIDMDFDYEKRGRIVEYLINKYGRDRVGNIGTKQTLKTKAALRRVIKILDPENTIVFDKYGKKIKDEHGENMKLENTILSTLPGLMKRADGTFVESVDEAYEEYSEFRRYMDQYPEVRRIASKMEGGISSYGMHAAGMVVSPVPLKYICPLHATRGNEDTDGVTKTFATQFTMSDVESLGLIKFDVLGLSTKTAISYATKMIKERYGVSLDLANLPLADKPTLALLNSGKTDGCFQLENTGMKQTLMQIGIDSFDDLVIAIAMYRPGPKDYIPELARRKKGARVLFSHPLMERITSKTYGIMCYQEQVMQVFMAMAGLTASDGYKFMKGCAKKKRELIEASKEMFYKGATANSVSKPVIDKVWADMEKFGGYAFNKSLSLTEKIITSKKDYTIQELYNKKCRGEKLPKVISQHGERIDIVDVYDHGVLPVWEVEFSDGSKHRCTKNHKFLTSSGVLPLWDIEQNHRQVIKFKGNKHGQAQGLDLRRVQSGQPQSKSLLGTQTALSRVERIEVSALCSSQFDQFQKVLGRKISRRNSSEGIQEKNVPGCVERNFNESRRDSASIRINEQSQQAALSFVSKQPSEYRNKNISAQRYSRSTQCSIEKMERRKSRRIREKMHNPRHEAEALAVGSRKISNENSNTSGFQAFSNYKKPEFYFSIIAPSDRFFRYGEKSVNRIRRAISFSEPPKQFRFNKSSNKRSGSKQRNASSRIFDNKNELRYLASTPSEIQIPTIGSIVNNSIILHRERGIENNWQSVSIKSIKFAGYEQCYDLEVDSDDHLYCLASGIVNSNSHACSYAYESFKTAYLKAHYPTEFFAARLSVELSRRMFEEVEKYEQDAEKNYNIKLLKPDLNRSKMNYTIVGEREILRPILSKGIGEKAAEEIIKHQPYKGSDKFFAFALKVGSSVNTKVIEAMCEAGLWGSVKKSKVINDFEQIKKDRKVAKGKPIGDIFE